MGLTKLYLKPDVNPLLCLLLRFLRLCLIICCAALIPDATAGSTSGTKCKLDRTYRVAIIEFGSTTNQQTLVRTLLHKLIEKQYLPPYQFEKGFNFDNESTYRLRMTQDLSERCLIFAPNSLYNAGWEEAKLHAMASELKDRIAKGEVDMVWALGKHAVDLMGSEDSPVPIIGMLSVDPAGRTGPDLSPHANVHVLHNTRLFAEFVEGYQDLYRHRAIGILKDRNPLFEVYADSARIREMTQKKGARLEICEGTFFTTDRELAHREFSRCMLELSQKQVEAVYLSELAAGPSHKFFFTQVRPLLMKKIFLYTYEGPELIQAGGLMGFYDDNMNSRASIELNVIDSYLKGQKIEQIPQRCTVPYFYAINLKTASIVQWRPSFSMLVATDTVYQSISSD